MSIERTLSLFTHLAEAEYLAGQFGPTILRNLSQASQSSVTNVTQQAGRHRARGHAGRPAALIESIDRPWYACRSAMISCRELLACRGNLQRHGNRKCRCL